MLGLLKTKINIGFIVNPFYLYCTSFSIAIFVFLWGWCSIFPKLSPGILLFFFLTFLIFIYTGYQFGKKNFNITYYPGVKPYFNDVVFSLILILGLVNVIYMGYLPIFNRSHNYREYGMPVIDPVFNTLSIFLSVFFVQSFLEQKKRRFLIYVFIIVLIHILLFRRSSVIWIIASSLFLLIMYKKRISLLFIAVAIICLPILSYSFGAYGNFRSKLSKSYVMNELRTSQNFKSSNISHYHYMTYLYVSSPLANLQENIDKRSGAIQKMDFTSFFFYCILPESFTLRLEKPLKLSPPICYLITPELIAGSFLMVAFFTLGWAGIIFMFIYLTVFIIACLILISKINTFRSITISLLATTVSLLIFSNFLNRLDVILMLFVYPVLFHLIYTINNNFQELAKNK
jgi:hypothetical protein